MLRSKLALHAPLLLAIEQGRGSAVVQRLDFFEVDALQRFADLSSEIRPTSLDLTAPDWAHYFAEVDAGFTAGEARARRIPSKVVS